MGRETLDEADLEVIRRYDVLGPRYTTYPPPTAWLESFGESVYRHSLESIAVEGRPAPLSLYVHIPFCPSMCWFCACNVLVTPRTDLGEGYLDHVEQEVGRVADCLRSPVQVTQLHWGGGSPTYLTPSQMRRLYRVLERRFSFHADAEILVEVDPRHTTMEQLEVLREMGFNRLSVGVQDFDPDVQVAVNRIQPEAQTRRFVESCRALGFRTLSIDMMYGLPRQTPASFARSLDALAAIRPERVALYAYAHLPWLEPFQRRIDASTIPNSSERFKIFRVALERMLAEGYEYLGLDCFALPDDELAAARREGTLQRNLMGYTNHAGADLIGVGLSSMSLVGGLYVQNEKKLNPYTQAVEQGRLPLARGYRLTRDDAVRADVIAQWMCSGRVDKAAIEARHGIRFDVYFDEELKRLAPLIADGLVEVRADSLETTLLGRILVRYAAMCFDATLKVQAQTAGAVARTA